MTRTSFFVILAHQISHSFVIYAYFVKLIYTLAVVMLGYEYNQLIKRQEIINNNKYINP